MTRETRDRLSGTTMLTQFGRMDFPTTSWTLVLAAADPNNADARDATDSVLDRAKQAIEVEDVEVRVAALEQAAELTKQSR
jgi:hypothetical protein